MPITIETVQHPTQDMQVEAVRVETDEDLLELRQSDWHDDRLRLLRTPSRVLGFIGTEPPLYLGGTQVQAPAVLLKGPAGDIEVHPAGTGATA